ncbi:carbohydrate ABC transporter membrane protein 2 (CUT1 family) [Salana multivorans]|uniref:Carbohydrate ABC transporter membrane protein 2 (CUT1 family) n=1 Tax=Salana multivorans TaxID=120377 RepID=A0A3N2D8U7_9MICO|nr:carbohydrate ABC transporter permease [Salana multivorans]ROR96132.1 carbohydrate ABC transporter membrane protein 2 (CUT1 family) [Salana multivorans]
MSALTTPGRAVRAIPRVVVMALLTLVVLGPIYWITVSSFKPRSELISTSPTLLPREWTLENFERLFATTKYPLFLSNSFVVAIGTTVVTLVVSIAAAYGLDRLRVPGAGKISGVVLLSYMIPGTLLIVPLYVTLAQLGLIDSHAGLVLVNVAFTAPFCTWLLRGFILAIPIEIDEAAALDGAGPLRTMFQIVLPLLLPGVATVAVYSFVFSWTEFVFASQFIMSDGLDTLPVGLKAIIGQYTVDWGLVTSATLFTLLPTVLLFLAVGRFFVGGLIAGATK